jgi:hypothetical protein
MDAHTFFMQDDIEDVGGGMGGGVNAFQVMPDPNPNSPEENLERALHPDVWPPPLLLVQTRLRRLIIVRMRFGVEAHLGSRPHVQDLAFRVIRKLHVSHSSRSSSSSSPPESS